MDVKDVTNFYGMKEFIIMKEMFFIIVKHKPIKNENKRKKANVDSQIHRKYFLKKKIWWEHFSTHDAVSELIQNGETILSSYDKSIGVFAKRYSNDHYEDCWQ